MNRFTLLLFVALATFFIVLWVKRPDIISNIWLWLVGLTGPIIAIYKKLKQEFMDSNLYKKTFKESETSKIK